ncbi:M20/M25/M40 family metallo-hydrolase [Bacillus sp. DTU_2020_1000418_1_SI_GHA_SEK_038]|uniref:M20/M25/M40 family metallo-hydrolase n=1 Tax=Bacillus sp. DTU_2020_1000418_1_SI_GHA_SEK_038 TaxID=3077585 RepID=UPI0028EE0190|nr:M20/M25/M40 family metallo-hydrolase [Bacillus sp. DTU_2020_1000418_1_SI_GHA_SEK_038]WNS76579.1 M20/M25/M40 family metallo-hydrolase [Bacillus sp. DTU_2020_1000418_1_SI_GHA_SEK_038]
MLEYQWATKEGLRNLLCEVVSWESRTLTAGEREFPEKLASKLRKLTYFQENPNHLGIYDADLGRRFVTALYKHPEAQETIVLISHFDTVFTEEYGDLEDYAFQPEKLTEMLYSRINSLPPDAQEDLLSGEYLFGRGTMDMKMGLVMHMGVIEKASIEKWPINLVLLTVPDEEVNSAGMRAAVVKLVEMKKVHGLNYKLFLNGEPVFSQQPGDNNYYVYSGSIGKIMPSVLFYGRETHVGEPLAGITAPYIASFMTQKMEWNEKFQETVLGEKTPLPVTLQQKDLKMEYSTQTPFRSTALYNVFLMKKNAAEIMDIFEEIAKEAAIECNEAYFKTCAVQNIRPVGQVRVLRYEQLLEHAVTKLGKVFVESVQAEVFANKKWDDREKCLRIVDTLMIECQELAPAMILLFAPPYYPAVNSSDCDFIKECVDYITEQGKIKFDLPVQQIHYFNGISDLSYVNYKDTGQGWTAFIANTPVWGECYSIPFEHMKELQAPVLNIGPFGKDAHKRTERLNTKSAFEEVPVLVEGLIKMISPQPVHSIP